MTRRGLRASAPRDRGASWDNYGVRAMLVCAVVIGCGKSAALRDDAAVVTVAIADPAGGDAAMDAANDATLAIPPPAADEVLVPAGGGLEPFYLDRDEVIERDYHACVAANVCSPVDGKANPAHAALAVGFLSILQARAYCAWRGKRIPTLAEWKRAALGDARTHPWGEDAPTCEHARLRGCGDGFDAPGRPKGTSPEGARDLFGNVQEWTDRAQLTFAQRCVDAPPLKAAIVGGWYARDIVEVKAQLADPEVEAGDETAGVRCARSGWPATSPPPSLDPTIAAITTGGWIVATTQPDAAIAHRSVTCPDGGLPLAGELVNRKGWLMVRSAHATESEAKAARADDGDVIAHVPAGLVRVVGTASCRDDHSNPTTPTLTVVAGTRRWRFDVGGKVYQLWLPAGSLVKLQLSCPPIDCGRPECGAGYAGQTSQIFRVPRGPASGVIGPQLQRFGGCTCD